MSKTPASARRSIALAGAALSLLLAAPILAQPEPPPFQDQPAVDRKAGMSERLRARLTELREEQDRINEALEMLEKGASPEDVMRQLRAGELGEGDRGPEGEDRPPERKMRHGPDGGPEGGPERDSPRDQDRPGPDRSREGRRPGPPQLDHDRIMAFARENFPELPERIERLKETNPEMADRLAARLGQRIMDIIETREHDTELADLKTADLRNGMAIVEALGQVRAARGDPTRTEAARGVLAERVADQFDIRAKLHRHEIDQLHRRLDRLQAELDRKLSKREESIRQRLEDMMSGKERIDPLGGDGPPPRDGKPREGGSRPDRPERRDGDKEPPPRP